MNGVSFIRPGDRRKPFEGWGRLIGPRFRQDDDRWVGGVGGVSAGPS